MTDQFAHLSGHPSLDVFNTVEWRLDPDRSSDRIADVTAMLDWCRESGLLRRDEHRALRQEADAHPRRSSTALRTFQEARDVAYAALLDRDAPAITRFSELQREAFCHAGLGPEGDSWSWIDDDVDLDTCTHRLVRSLVELMRSDQITRLRRCADDACGWAYLDTSPRRNRRWCAANDCGDRNRARAYYRRRQEAAS